MVAPQQPERHPLIQILSLFLIPQVIRSVGILEHLLCAVHCGRDGGGSSEAVRGKKSLFS